MYVKKETIDEYFKNKKLVLVVDDLFRKLEIVCMLSLGDFFVFFWFFCSLRKKLKSLTILWFGWFTN